MISGNPFTYLLLAIAAVWWTLTSGVAWATIGTSIWAIITEPSGWVIGSIGLLIFWMVKYTESDGSRIEGVDYTERDRNIADGWNKPYFPDYDPRPQNWWYADK